MKFYLLTHNTAPHALKVRSPTLLALLKKHYPQSGTGFLPKRLPPCTDVSVSGAAWFAAKALKDKHFQAKAALIAEQCRMVGQLSGAPWFFENPVSVFSSIFGKPNYSFHPWQYTALEPNDNYTKKTCLWTGNGFVLPEPDVDTTLGAPDNRIHFAAPSPERANIRSATPMGFAQAVYKELTK